MMKVNLDLVKDFENIVLADIAEFKRQGFKFHDFDEWKIGKAGKDICEDTYKRDLMYSYANLRERMIDAKPRKILYASNFKQLSDYEEGLKFLENKIRTGNNLIPHLSRQIFSPREQDGMLFDFGIYHLHLGTTADTKHPYLIQGREKVLYCLFDNEFAYFLVIDKHGRWSDLDLLRIIKESFPKKLETWEVQGVVGLTYNPTVAERQQLRKAGISTAIELDGKVYFSPGGGINTAKTSVTAVLKMNHFYHKYQDIEKMIKEYFANDNEVEQKLKTDILNLSLQSFTPFKLIDQEKGIVVELMFSNGNVKISVGKTLKEQKIN